MKSTSIQSDATRIIPASQDRKAVKVTKNADGSMAVVFGNGQTGTIEAGDKDIQAFLVYTMLNPDCAK